MLKITHTRLKHRLRRTKLAPIAVSVFVLLVIFQLSSFTFQSFTQDTQQSYKSTHSSSTDITAVSSTPTARHLSSGEAISLLPEGCHEDLDKQGGVVLYLFVALYMFVALAIVCDDYFVEALDKFSAALNLSEDVAGATLLAMGSSAPELFTSVVSVFFSQSNAGFGTIVGSAVFNILVIIGLTAILAGQELKIDWYPFTRDGSVYIISIVLLIVFFLDSVVQWWEALILLLFYGVYILIMYKNQQIQDYLKGKVAAMQSNNKERRSSMSALKSAFTFHKDGSKKDKTGEYEKSKHSNPMHDPQLRRASSKLMCGEEYLTGLRKVRKITTVISASNAFASTLANIQVSNDKPLSPMTIAARKAKEAREKKKQQEQQQAQSDDTIVEVAQSESSTTVVDNTKPMESEEDVEQPQPQEDKQEEKEQDEDAKSVRSEPKFLGTIGEGLDKSAKPAENQDGDDDEEYNPGPLGIFMKWFTWPLRMLFHYTIPDCSDPKWEDRYLLSFFMSIFWIAACSYFMVIFAERAGCIIGIPPIVMGLTVLAAGTSVPDALASVIVAKTGQGDMAVANAIGSNVFDILIGLGLPWLIKGGFMGDTVSTGTDDLLISIILLFAVAAFVVISLVVFGWALRPKLGYFLIALYVCYVIWNLLLGFNVISL